MDTLQINVSLFRCLFVCLMMLNATFNNISVISWGSVLLVEKNGGPEENHDLSQVTDKLYQIMLYTSPRRPFFLDVDDIDNYRNKIIVLFSVEVGEVQKNNIPTSNCDKILLVFLILIKGWV